MSILDFLHHNHADAEPIKDPLGESPVVGPHETPVAPAEAKAPLAGTVEEPAAPQSEPATTAASVSPQTAPTPPPQAQVHDPSNGDDPFQHQPMA